MGYGTKMSGYPTSTIGLCQEAKSLPDALGRSAGVNSSVLQRVVLASRPWFLFEDRTRLPFAGAAGLLPIRLSCVFLPVSKLINGSCRGLTLLRPVGLTGKTWQASR